MPASFLGVSSRVYSTLDTSKPQSAIFPELFGYFFTGLQDEQDADKIYPYPRELEPCAGCRP
jgi:hypothetical protein